MNIRVTIFLFVLLLCAALHTVDAKRTSPPSVPEIHYKNIIIFAENTPATIGVVKARDARGTLVWQVTVYSIQYNQALERDVQDVFISAMTLKGNDIVITNEKGYIYRLNLETHVVTVVKGESVIQ